MTRVRLFAVAIAFVLAGLAADTPKPNYLPLARGARWEYRRTYFAEVKSIELRRGEPVEGDDAATVRFAGDFESLGLEERMLLTSEGVSHRGGEGRGEKPRALIRNAFKAGEQWDALMPIGCGGFAPAKATAGGPEEVKVPAGTFKAVKVTYTATVFKAERSMLVWYADGVGVVKQVYCPDSSNIVIELVKYTPGK